jgi:multicomponent Na+:H+ antiporter subunit D
MTAGYLLTITIHGFFPGENPLPEGHEAPKAMWIPMLVLAILSVLVGLFPNMLIGHIQMIISAIFT